MSSELPWSTLERERSRVRERWPRIWSLPRIARATRRAASAISKGERVLDVGASDGRFGRKLSGGVEYRTLDVDPLVEADYRSLAEVGDSSHDVVVCFETIEHLDPDGALGLATGIARVLVPGGRLFLSTPNVHHPWAYLRDATHRTPWNYDELGGLLAIAGLEVDAVHRCHHDSLLKGVVRRLAWPLYRLLDVDFADSILVEAHRPNESTSSEN